MNNIELYFDTREKVLSNFKNITFPIKDKILTPEHEQSPEQPPEPKLAPTRKQKKEKKI